MGRADARLGRRHQEVVKRSRFHGRSTASTAPSCRMVAAKSANSAAELHELPLRAALEEEAAAFQHRAEVAGQTAISGKLPYMHPVQAPAMDCASGHISRFRYRAGKSTE